MTDPIQKDPSNPSPFPPPPQPIPAAREAPAKTGQNKLKSFWDSIRSNKYFVAFEGGFYGALVNYAYDGLTSGHLDFTHVGLQKAAAFALTGGITAVRLLYRPQPTPTIVATIPPSTELQDVPAILTPANPEAKAAQPVVTKETK